MTKAEALQKIKALMKEAAAKKKQGLLTGSAYSGVENSLNSVHMNLQLGKIPVSEAELVISAVESTIAGATGKAGMTPEEYKKQKSAMYQKYKAGEITNYAYIQWKKKNDPALNPSPAPAAPAPKKKDFVLPAMTDDEYDQMSDEIAQMFKDGIITPDEKADLDALLNDLKKNGSSFIDAKEQLGFISHAEAEAEKKVAKEEAEKFAAAQAGSADPGTAAADQAVEKLEKELKKVYGQAVKEMTAKLKEFVDEYGDKLAEKQQLVAEGKMTQAEFQAWVDQQGEIIHVMQTKIDQMSGTMLNANQKAMGMVNGQMVSVFAENANFQSYQLAQDAKLNLMFSVYDEHTAEKLIKDKPELLPRKVVNGKKDKAWNQKKIANAVIQSVIQGESIHGLAKRIAMQTGESNMKAMIRYARTAMTSAQNSGRMEMLHKAQGLGIQCKKVWLATLDSRTRDVHAKLDGQTAEVDEPFHSDLGEIMFPGDMGSKGSVPANLYNCRCTLTYEYEGFPNDPTADQRLQYDEYYTTEVDAKGKEHKVYHRESRLIQDMTYPEWKAAKEGTKLNDLNTAKYQLAEAQKAVIKAKIKEDKVYSDLWKDPVTLADYPAKKAGIAAKRDYYTAEIDKYKQAIADGKSWATPEKLKELEKKRKLLNEFERNGQLLEKRDAALKQVQDIYDQVGFAKAATAPAVAQNKAAKKAKKAGAAAGGTGEGAGAGAQPVGATAAKKGQFAPDAWSDKTKKAAPFYDSKYEADKVLRPELDAMWDTLTDAEKYAVWEYTNNSNPINRSLSGYHDSFSRDHFLGYENAVWGYEDSWRRLPPYWQKFGENGHSKFHRAITDFTKAIEKAPLHEDIWFKRQSGEGGFAGILEGAGMDFNTAMMLIQNNPSKLIGLRAKNHAFTSCGMAKDAQWNGNVYYKIFCPKGTKGMYSEPQSNYGHTSPHKIYKKGTSYTTIGTEAEVVLQRGTEFRITGITKRGNDYYVDMEVVAQPDYFVHGDEDTFNDGKTRHKR